ncbi:hypothetical protein [Microcystis phage vB_MweS-yong2]|nr:hypothetical protein [Microcystis phage vB_MweS-yong2]
MNAAQTIPTEAGPLLRRISEIDAMFDAAAGWGSWMVEAANEREALVDRLAADHGVTVEHKWQARRSGGRRAD